MNILLVTVGAVAILLLLLISNRAFNKLFTDMRDITNHHSGD